MVDYLFIPAKNFSGEVKVTDQDVTAYYDAHKKDFAIPPKVDVAYVSVTPGRSGQAREHQRGGCSEMVRGQQEPF